MNNIISQYNIFLDTKYLNEGTNTFPKFSLNEPIKLSNDNNYFTAKIISAEIPFSFKTVSAPYNRLKIRVQETAQHNIDVSDNITLTEGNYSIISLLDELKQKITDYLQTINVGNFQSHLPTFDFLYSRETGKCTLNIIAGGGNHAVTITILWSLNDILATFFGFTFQHNTVLSYLSNGTLTSQNYISPNHVNVSPITSLYIRSSTLNQQRFNQERLVEYDMTISDILLKVPVNSYYNTWLIFENETFEVRLNNKHIDDISLYLTALTYDPISLNGVSWRVLLQITEYESPITVKIKQDKEEKMRALTQKRIELMKELQQVRDELTNDVLI
jgi:hypothetical protein